MKTLTPAKLTLIMFVVVGGLIVAYVAKGLLAREEPKPQPTTRNVPMPLGDIEPGTVITENHVGVGPILISKLEQDMLLNNKGIVGRIAKEKLKAGTPIRASQLLPPGQYPALQVGEGMRATTVDIDGSAGLVDGLIKPGQYCDVHMTVTDFISDSRGPNALILTLFKGVRILAINRFTQQGAVDKASNSVTFELTPEQSNIILLASKKSTLSLTYNPNGKGDGGIAVNNKDRVMLYEILGLAPPQAPKAPFTVQIYRQANRAEVIFGPNNTVTRRWDNTPVVPVPDTNTQSDPDPAPREQAAPGSKPGVPENGNTEPAKAAQTSV